VLHSAVFQPSQPKNVHLRNTFVPRLYTWPRRALEESFASFQGVLFMRGVALALVFICLMSSGVVRAQSGCTAISADCVAVGEWDFSVSLGIGERSNPIVNGSDIPLVVIPQISYYGKRFFIENLDVGITLFESPTYTVNLLATPGYDRVFFVRDDLQNYFIPGATGSVSAPTPELEAAIDRPRRTTYLGGVEWLVRAGAVALQLDALYEARGAVALPLLQTENSIVINTGFTWKSREIVDYYYGVEPVYSPDAAFNPFIKLGYSRALSDRLTVNAFAHYEQLDDAIANSPIVVDRGVLTLFAGVVLKVF
jgi:outer membrane protein